MSKWIVITHCGWWEGMPPLLQALFCHFLSSNIASCRRCFDLFFQPSWPRQVRWKFPLLHACDCMCLKLFIQEYTLIMYCKHLSGFESPGFASTTTNQSWQAMPVLKRSDRDMLWLLQKLRPDEQIMWLFSDCYGGSIITLLLGEMIQPLLSAWYCSPWWKSQLPEVTVTWYILPCPSREVVDKDC